MSALPQRVLIIGTGLIGTSIGMALTRAGVTVHLSDRDPGTAEEAQRCGGGVAEPPSHDPDVVIVAVPPASVARVAAEALRDWPSATVTDVCSVKAGPARELVATGADMSRWVGGHPMAGREVSGPAAARVELFDDRVWVIAPSESVARERVDSVVAIVEACGATALEMTADEHDRTVAVTSHVPQILSSVLAARLAEVDQDRIQVSGQGLRDMTRIAASDPDLWAGIIASNPSPIAEVLDEVLVELSRLRAALDSGDTGQVRDVIVRGNVGVEAIPGKHGGQSAPFDVVPVLIADEPGQLGEVFVAAGAAGFNLEDVRIEHVLGRPSGLVEVSVRAGLGDALADALRARGFDVRD